MNLSSPIYEKHMNQGILQPSPNCTLPQETSFFFGTDSSEVIRTISQWESQAKNDWERFQNVKVGELKNVSTLLADDGQMGSIVCEIPADLTVGGQQTHSLYRLASTVRKENGEWRFVHGMIAVATAGQSSAGLVAKMKAEAATPVHK